MSLSENVRILIQISLTFVLNIPINNASPLVQIKTWRTGKPESELVAQLTDVYMRRSA